MEEVEMEVVEMEGVGMVVGGMEEVKMEEVAVVGRVVDQEVMVGALMGAQVEMEEAIRGHEPVVQVVSMLSLTSF